MAHDHGVLSTVHPTRGVDAVPVVFSVVDEFVGIPVDQVKPKSSFRLQRERNLETDPRATLLIEHWDRDDWNQLWWVRAELRWEGPATDEQTAQLGSRLSTAFRQYDDHPFASILALRIVGVSGWAATEA